MAPSLPALGRRAQGLTDTIKRRREWWDIFVARKANFLLSAILKPPPQPEDGSFRAHHGTPRFLQGKRSRAGSSGQDTLRLHGEHTTRLASAGSQPGGFFSHC